MSFSDSDKFMFVLMGDGHLTPVHYRDLGQKEGHVYSKKVSWVDATINNVPLEQTFRYEDEIEHIKDPTKTKTNVQGFIIVNERPTHNVVSDDIPCMYQKKWENRLSKMAQQPMTLPHAKKKKKGPQRFPVKPKTDVRCEVDYSSSDKFQELIDTKSLGILGDHIYTIRVSDGYEKHISWAEGGDEGDDDEGDDDEGDDDEGDDGWGMTRVKSFKKKTYCPPEHWLTPVFQWENIWTHMDEIEHGYKRDYVYVPEGELCPDSIIMGPAIYFFDYENLGTAQNKCWVTASKTNTCHAREINDSYRLSKTSYLSRVEKAYLRYPSKETLKDYQDGWKLTQPEYEAYYQCMSDGFSDNRLWGIKVMLSNSICEKIAPQPHL